MLSLSHTTGYAVLALSCLRQCGSKLMLARDIAQCTGIPLPYLLKLMLAMGKAELVVAKRGYRGGFALARPAETISLLDVAEAVEGQAWLPRCLLGLDECSDKRGCPTHDFWKVERLKIEAKLHKTTLKDVAEFEARQVQRRLGQCCASAPAPKTPAGRKPRRTTARSARKRPRSSL
ncbi:MAG: Rrf2 family transcriptional regulator [Phycisphaeraceae bacterium]